MSAAPPIVSVADAQAVLGAEHAVIAGASPTDARVLAALRAAEGVGRQYLGRPVRVHLHRETLPLRYPNTYATTGGDPFGWAAAWPVVAVTTPVSGAVVLDGARRIAYAEGYPYSDVAYFAGWKRADETVQALRGYDGLADLPADALVPDVPAEIVEAICETAVYVLGRHGAVGKETTTTQTGSTVKTVSGFRIRLGEVRHIWATYASHLRTVSV